MLYLKSFCIHTAQDKHCWSIKKVHQTSVTVQEQVPRVSQGCNYLENFTDLLLRPSDPNRWWHKDTGGFLVYKYNPYIFMLAGISQ